MIISAIFAISENNVIGKENGLPWHLPADLRYFKKTTLNHPVIMGRKSYESIGRPLPKRTNIIVTRNKAFKAENVRVAHSLPEAFLIAGELQADEVFVIGGADLYLSAMPYCDRIYLTLVHAQVEGDTYMEQPDLSDWKLISEKACRADEKNIYDYTFRVYERI